MSQKIIYYLFTWSTLPRRKDGSINKDDRKFFYSLRTVNDPSNSVQGEQYASRSGRNIAVLKVVAEKPEGSIKIMKRVNPKDWLKNRAKWQSAKPRRRTYLWIAKAA